MAQYREDYLDIDLISGSVNRSFCNKLIGEGDILGNLFGVRVYRGKDPVTLTGVSCVGLFIKPDGNTVTISGMVSGNAAYVILPTSCYTANGQFQLSIKLAGNGITTTARIVDGTVINTNIGDLIDPGSVIPDLSSYTSLVEAAEAAAETISEYGFESVLIAGTRYRINVVTTS